MSLSKSTKRRKCLEECEELGLAIESSKINDEHFNVTNQPSISYEHKSDHKVLNNCVGGKTFTTNFSTESNHSDSEGLDRHLTVDKVIDDRQNDIILVPTFSSDSDNGNECYSEKLFTKIKYWAIEHKISYLELSNLLKVLKNNHDCFHYFPCDACTLIKTSMSNNPLQIQIMSPGIFHYFGLANGLKATIEKPSDSNIYLSDLVNELKELSSSGIDLPSSRKQIKLEAISYDARCKTVGVFLERRDCFPVISFNKHTHTKFINRSDEDYQMSDSISSGISVFSEIPDIDMVNSFPFDYSSIKNSPLSVRIPSKNVKLISTRLLNLKISITCDFVRIPRGLNEVLRFKATEFRTFILYTGPVVLHYYVHKFGEIYGEEFLSHNIHALLHLCDDYSKFGLLDNCSCFPYENFMLTLKRMVRSNAKPLQQVIKRYEEFILFGKLVINDIQCTQDVFKHLHFDGPLSTFPQYKTVYNMDPFDQCMSKNQLYLMNSQSEIMNNSSEQFKYHESSTLPIKKKVLTVNISHPNLNKDPQEIIETSDKVQRNLFGKSRSSPSPLKIQWLSPKRKK
ncbi:Myb DNA-bind 5 domain-containing protein, partial [Aphis craccivora]